MPKYHLISEQRLDRVPLLNRRMRVFCWVLRGLPKPWVSEWVWSSDDQCFYFHWRKWVLVIRSCLGWNTGRAIGDRTQPSTEIPKPGMFNSRIEFISRLSFYLSCVTIMGIALGYAARYIYCLWKGIP